MDKIDLEGISFDRLRFEVYQLQNSSNIYRNKIEELRAIQKLAKEQNLEEPLMDLLITPAEEDEEEMDLIEDLERQEAKENAGNEMEYYMENYRSLPDDFTRDDFFSALPSPKHERYKEILMRLHAESEKEKKGIRQLLEFAETKEDLEGFKSMLIREGKKISFLKEEEQAKESGTSRREIKNTIIVYPHILEEMEKINSKAYPHFKKLINSIIDGTFKNVKTFNNDINGFGGISQVKFYQSRVAFKKIDNHTYALVTCFTKKVDMDKLYKDTYKKKITDFKNDLLDYTKMSINNPEFMAENALRVEELYQIMDSNQKVEGSGK